MAAAQSMLGKLGIGTADPVDFALDFRQESLMCREEFLDGNGLRGTFQHDVSRVRRSIRRVGGQISLQPNAEELEKVLPWILGGTPSGTTYPLSDTSSTRYITIDRVAKVFTYDGCKVDTAQFRASRGQLLGLDLDVIGIDETVGNAGTFPSLSIDTASGPFVFSDLALTHAGDTYTPQDFNMSIRWKIDRDRFFNSNTLVSVVPTDLEIMVETRLPYGDATAVYNSGPGGVAIVATFTNGTVSLSFSLVKVCFPRQSPVLPNRSEVMVPLRGFAYKSGATAKLVTTLDSTP
jgi:hypothetical protein